MHTNRLAREKSPYLLQHAHNPVDWYPWNEEAFQKARAEDKPIFLSIGYSTCHWCHVMERESFESEEVASILNRSFVPIKIDREERPDIDRIYMTFVQATTGSGGWPMSVWLTPELKPFFGGTYFPPDNRYGRPGFRAILEYLSNAWVNDRPRIETAGREVLDQLDKMVSPQTSPAVPDAPGAAETCFLTLRRSFDSRLGGFGGAPKFPRPVSLSFLFRHYHRTRNDEALGMALLTLNEMAKGGMNDQLGGGFHRYSVDAQWLVPHFEKMLYDQAQLAIAYIEAFLITHEPHYASIARDIFDYVVRDMTHPEGAFYSAEDADSVIDPAEPKHKGEGAFYIWSADEIRQILRSPEADWFSYRYGVKETGNVDEDPHGEFTGRNILFEQHTIEETARHFNSEPGRIALALDLAKERLLGFRSRRIRPHLDDKILTSWNGLMISAFARGAQALADPKLEQAARRAADFILGRLYDPASGDLLRRFRDGEAGIPGFLDDYAFFIQGLLDLYQASFNPNDLETAIRLAHRLCDLFEDRDNGGFFSTRPGGEDLVLRMKDDYDGAEPSGNSMAVHALVRLAHLTNEARFREAADRALRIFASRLRTAPITVPQMVVAALDAEARPAQVIVAGEIDAGDTRALLSLIREQYRPNLFVLLAAAGDSRGHLAARLPYLAHAAPVDGQAAAYLCRDYACQLPVTNPDDLVRLLQ